MRRRDPERESFGQGLENIKSENARKKAAIVLVTDGGSDPSAAAALREKAKILILETLGLGISVEREWLMPWCDHGQGVPDLARIDDANAETLFAA